MEDKAMGKLLKLVFFRLRKEKAPMIEAFIAIGYAFLMAVIYFVIYQAALSTGSTAEDVGISLRSMILQTITPGYNVPAVLIVAGVASFFYTEINYGTLRNQIVSGYSRKEIYTAYWIGMQIYMLVMLTVYAASIALLSSILLPNGFTNENVGPFFLSLLLGIVYEMAITSLAFFLIVLIKFPAWPIVIVVMASVASMIVSLVVVANNLMVQKPNMNVFYILPWMPDIQAAILQSGDLSVVATSSGLSTVGAITSKTIEDSIGAAHVDYTAYSTFAILTESILITIGSFLGGFFYFNHHDLK